MAIADAKKRKIGVELIDWIYLGVRTGARRGVEQYRALLSEGRTADAQAALRRAVDLPHRARARIAESVRLYNQRFGSGGVAFFGECLGLVGSVTVAEVDAELATLETYAANLVANAPTPYGNGSMTWAQIADNIEANVELESNDWTFPLPAGYTDVWGE